MYKSKTCTGRKVDTLVSKYPISYRQVKDIKDKANSKYISRCLICV